MEDRGAKIPKAASICAGLVSAALAGCYPMTVSESYDVKLLGDTSGEWVASTVGGGPPWVYWESERREGLISSGLRGDLGEPARPVNGGRPAGPSAIYLKLNPGTSQIIGTTTNHDISYPYQIDICVQTKGLDFEGLHLSEYGTTLKSEGTLFPGHIARAYYRQAILAIAPKGEKYPETPCWSTQFENVRFPSAMSTGFDFELRMDGFMSNTGRISVPPIRIIYRPTHPSICAGLGCLVSH